jgi:GNAT superfamily N-acetyltransferase
MSGDLFSKYSSAARDAYAAGMNCSVDDFGSEQLTIVKRPADKPWYTVSVATFGTGTVLSVNPSYYDFVEANRPAKHYRAMSGEFLASIVAEGARRGESLGFSTASLCFTIAHDPPDIELPPNFELREHDKDWMSAEMGSGRFENGAGAPNTGGREFRNRFALVLYDGSGEPVAVAGAFDTHGMLEIGVDVLREHRGRGLGRLVVSRMARHIMRQGGVPFYGCAPTNIRSQHTAASCGFRPVCADAGVWPTG